MYDPRYTFVTCPSCKQQFQRIDWNCARHQLTCGYPCPAPAEGYPTDRTIEGWRKFDVQHGLKVLKP